MSLNLFQYLRVKTLDGFKTRSTNSFWKDLQEGDVFVVNYNYHGSTYSDNGSVTNLRTGLVYDASLQQIYSILGRLDCETLVPQIAT
jgi:hypothetical protein